MLAQLKRDPFGRRTLMRLSHRSSGTCAWCGQSGHRQVLYRYAWVGDAQHSSRAGWSPAMCSVGCYRSYADED